MNTLKTVFTSKLVHSICVLGVIILNVVNYKSGEQIFNPSSQVVIVAFGYAGAILATSCMKEFRQSIGLE